MFISRHQQAAGQGTLETVFRGTQSYLFVSLCNEFVPSPDGGMEEKMRGKKLIAVLLTVFVCLTAAACGTKSAESSASATSAGSAVATDGDVYEMKIAHSTSESDPIHKGWLYLKDILEARSEGRIKVTIYPNKTLCSGDNEQAEMVKNGSIQMSSAPSYTLVAMNETLNKLYIYDFPYLFGSNEELYKFGDSDLAMEIMDDMRTKIGVIGYGPYPLGWVKVSSNKKPIDAPEALKGLKIRTTTSEMYMALMDSWGGNPTPMNYGEVFTGLQQGAIDGMMTTTSLYVSDRFYEVQKYMGCINPFAIAHYPIVNEAWYNSLPEDVQTVFDECVWEYLAEVRKYEEDYEAEAIKILAEKGMDVVEYDDTQMAAFREPAMELWDSKVDMVGADFFAEVREMLGK
jgi:C4-dicarboxylate-binding protein DctP